MIIKPTNQITGLTRFNPVPGFYRAKLKSVTRSENKKGKPTMRLEWELLSHPDKNNTYMGFRTYPLKNPGYLSQTFWEWKRLLWENLIAMEQDGLARPERFEGDEADIQILPCEPGRKQITNVGTVLPPGSRVEQLEDGSYRPYSREDIFLGNIPAINVQPPAHVN